MHARRSCSRACPFRSWRRAASTPAAAGARTHSSGAGTAGRRAGGGDGGGGGLGLAGSQRRASTAEGRPAPQPSPGAAGGRSSRAAAAVSHQMSPSAAKAAPGADNGRAGPRGGPGYPGRPHSRASADTYSPASTLGLPSPLPRRWLRLPSPLGGAWPSCHPLLSVPSPYLLIASSFRTPGRYHLLQEAIPGLPFSKSAQSPAPKLGCLSWGHPPPRPPQTFRDDVMGYVLPTNICRGKKNE